MGQAKARGTFAQREAEAIERNRKEQLAREERERARQQAEREWLASLPAKKRQSIETRRREARMLMAVLSGFIAIGSSWRDR